MPRKEIQLAKAETEDERISICMSESGHARRVVEVDMLERDRAAGGRRTVQSTTLGGGT